MSLTPSHPVTPDAAQANQMQGQAILVWTVGAFCIHGWDWILCLPQEYQCIWRRKFSPISVLYLVNRYFGFLQLSIVVSLMASGWSPEACKNLFYWNPVGFLISTLLSQMILGVRVYAIYSQSRVVLVVLSFIFLVEVCLGGITVNLTSALVAGDPGNKLPCGALPAPLGWMIAFFSVQLFFDTVTFLLTAWKIYDIWRKEADTTLIAVIWRDGISYFFAICTMNFINVLIFAIAPNSLTWVANLTPTVIFTVLLSCRLVLNLRNTLANAVFPAASTELTANGTKVRTNLGHNRGTSPKSERIDPSLPTLVKSESGPGWDGIGDCPNGMV